jgi:hypothetical protein
MNTTQHLSMLLALPQPDFDSYVQSIGHLIELRKSLQPTSPLEVSRAAQNVVAVSSPSPAEPSMATNGLVPRPPMRAAKSGSLRGEIHGVLKASAKPLRRSEIIAAVARRRNQTVDDIFRGKVSDILTNTHDPFIQRVAHGTYAFVAGHHLAQ